MSRHWVYGLASSALVMRGSSRGVAASLSQAHHRAHYNTAVPGPQVFSGMKGERSVVRRSLQSCSAAEGFTVTSDVFPEMNGCYAEEEVPQNGSGKRLEVMRYSLSDRSANFEVGEFNPYFGYKWRASYYEGVVGGEYVLACLTNENIAMDLQPADPTLTWECDLNGDGTLETPMATDEVLSMACGCATSASGSGGNEPLPAPASITPIAPTPPSPTMPTFTTAPASMTPSPTVALAHVSRGTSTTAPLVRFGPATTSEPTVTTTRPRPVAQPATSDMDSVCSNGLAGFEADEVCCQLSCGTCGGVGCGSAPGLTGDQCCITTIQDTGDFCSITGSAPCRLDPPEVNPSTCPNGLPGVADGDACCTEACNSCGGVNCGIISGTNGATDCCSGVILASGVLCDDSAAAPCIMTYGGGSSYRAPFTSGSGSDSTLSMAPTPAGYTTAPTVVDGSSGGVFASAAPTSGHNENAAAIGAPVVVVDGRDTSGVGDAWSIGSAAASRIATLAALVGGMIAVHAAGRD